MAHITKTKEFKKGKEGEEIIKNKILENDNTEFVSWNNNNSHDFIIKHGEKEISYEIKTDYYENPVNFFFEYKSRNKPSGISVVQADYFVYYFRNKNKAYFIETEQLKSLLKSGNFVKKQMWSSGEGTSSGTWGLIVPIKEVEKHFDIVEI